MRMATMHGLRIVGKALLALFLWATFASAATLMPPGKITFLDSNGNPLTSGTVTFYIPNTLTLKNTWQDADQTILNTNPVVLDSAGRAIIYGSGEYRQIVKDSLGNTIWDQETASTDPAQAFAWGGTSAGSANNQTVTASGFTLTAGSKIIFIAGFTNTGAMTLNVNGGGATAVTKETPGGPTALTGKEVVAGNVIEADYDGTQFQLITNNEVIIGPLTDLASAATASLGTVPGHNVNITGTTGITSFGSAANTNYPIYYLTFAGSLTLTHNATSMILPGNRTITTQAGDTAVATYLGSGNWKVREYSPLRPQIVTLPQGRLTLTTGTPVLVADVTAATTIYYTPYLGNSVPIYNGLGWTSTAFSEISMGLDANHLANSNYDLFLADDAGTLRMCSGPAWTSDTGRGTGAGTTELVRFGGLWSNAVSMTCRYGASTFTVGISAGLYVGTFRTTAANGQTEMTLAPAAAAGGTASKLFLWNLYNQVETASISRDSTDSWTYTTLTWRSANNNANNRVSYIRGLNQGLITASYTAYSTVASAEATRAGGIGLDSTSALGDGVVPGSGDHEIANLVEHWSHYRSENGGLGLHFVQALEISQAAGTVTWRGDLALNGVPIQMTLAFEQPM